MAGLYEEANKQLGDGVRSAASGLSAKNVIPNASAAINGAPGLVADAYDKGGIGAAVGQGVRSAAGVPLGLAQDAFKHVAKGTEVATDAMRPIAEGLSTAVRTAVTGNAEPVKLGGLSAAATASRGLSASAADLMKGPDTTSPLGGASPLQAFTNPQAPKTPGLPLSAAAQPPAARHDLTSIDMNLANERLARANQIRQDYLDSQAGSNGGPKGGVIENRGPEETNAQFRASRQNDMIRNAINSGDPKMAEAVASGVGVMAGRDAEAARLAARDRNDEADRRQQEGIEMARLGIDRGRLGIDQQNSLISAIGAGLDNQVKQGQLTEQQRRSSLIDAVMNETDPAKRAAAERNIRLLSGNVPQESTKLEEARMGLVGELMKSYSQQPPLDPKTREPIPFEEFARPALAMAGQQGAPVNVSAGAVAALKENPQRAAEFDQKFGAGAAARYLAS